MPKKEESVRAPTVMRLRSDETNDLFALYASLHEIDRAKSSLEKRLRSIPGAWRDISLLRSVLSKLVDRILETVPPEKLVSISRNMRCMTYRVYLSRPVTIPHDEVLVDGEDLEVLTRYAHGYTCVGCDKDCNKCELGKALDHVMIQCRGYHESWSWIDCDRDYDDKDVMRVD